MKKNLFLIAALTSLFAFASCSNLATDSAAASGSSGNHNGSKNGFVLKGNVSSPIGGVPENIEEITKPSEVESNAKSAFPQVSGSVYYHIYATDSNSSTRDATVTVSGTTVSYSITVFEGSWTLYAEGYRNYDSSTKTYSNKILSGSQAFTVNSEGAFLVDATTVTEIPLTVSATSESGVNGTVSLKISVSSDSGISSCDATWGSKTETIFSSGTSGTFTMIDDSDSTSTGVEPGTQSVTFRCYKGTGDLKTLAYSFVETVNVFSNLETNTWIDNTNTKSTEYTVTKAMASSYASTVYYVDGTNGSDAASANGSYFNPFKTVQHAYEIIAAKNDSVNEYTIYLLSDITLSSDNCKVYSGSNETVSIYSFINPDFALKLTIDSYGSTRKTIDGAGTYFAFDIDGSGTITIQNINAKNTVLEPVKVSGGKAYLKNMTITGSNSSGFYMNGGTAVLNNIAISGSKNSGISIESGNLTATNCSANDNTEGGIWTNTGTVAVFNNTTVKGNKMSGVWLTDGNVTVNGGKFYSNQESGLGTTTGILNINNADVYENTSAGVIACGGEINVTGGSYYKNQHGILNAGSEASATKSVCTVTGAEVYSNGTTSDHNGISNYGGSLTVKDCNIHDNYGHAIYFSQFNRSGTFTFSSNTAVVGDICVKDGSNIIIPAGTMTPSTVGTITCESTYTEGKVILTGAGVSANYNKFGISAVGWKINSSGQLESTATVGSVSVSDGNYIFTISGNTVYNVVDTDLSVTIAKDNGDGTTTAVTDFTSSNLTLSAYAGASVTEISSTYITSTIDETSDPHTATIKFLQGIPSGTVVRVHVNYSNGMNYGGDLNVTVKDLVMTSADFATVLAALPDNTASVPRYDFTITDYSATTSSTVKTALTAAGNANKKVSLDLSSCTSLTSVASSAFYNAATLERIVLPSTVTSISSSAFQSCTSLSSVVLSEDLKTIDSNAFYGTTALTSITLPDSLTSIGTCAFTGSGLTSVVLPANLYSVTSAFKNCTNLSSVTFPGKNVYYENAFIGTNVTSVTIPSGATEIMSYSFKNLTTLTSISLPSTLVKISEYAFMSCTGLTTVTIPEGVTTVSVSAFNSCTNLTTVVWPKTLTSVGSNVFSGSGLTTINFRGTEAEWTAIGYTPDSGVTVNYNYTE